MHRVASTLRAAVLVLAFIAASIGGLPLPLRRHRLANRAAATQRVRPVRRTVVVGTGARLTARLPSPRP